jgi:transglutaminase-like putative cysteine protease
LEQLTLRNFSGVMTQPLRGGDAGVEQTIAMMRQLVDDAVKDPVVNRYAIGILQNANVSPFDRDQKLRALYADVSKNYLYVEDPVGPLGPKETLRPVRALMQIRAGDCDDFTTLFAALAGTIGIPTRAVTIAADPSAPHDFSHIYPEAEIYPGMWVALDAARPGADYGVEPPRYFRKRIWSLTGSGFRDVSGVRCTSLNGYAVLGDIDSNVAAQDISAVGQSVANVIAATKGNPWGSFSTPYSPSGIAPAAGYGVPGYSGGPGGATLSFAGSSALWWILGIGAVAYAISSARKY